MVHGHTSDIRHLLGICTDFVDGLDNLGIRQARCLQCLQQLRFDHGVNAVLHFRNWHTRHSRHLLRCRAKVFDFLDNLGISQIWRLQHVQKLLLHHSTDTLLHLLHGQASHIRHLLCRCSDAVQFGGNLLITQPWRLQECQNLLFGCHHLLLKLLCKDSPLWAVSFIFQKCLGPAPSACQ